MLFQPYPLEASVSTILVSIQSAFLVWPLVTMNQTVASFVNPLLNVDLASLDFNDERSVNQVLNDILIPTFTGTIRKNVIHSTRCESVRFHTSCSPHSICLNAHATGSQYTNQSITYFKTCFERNVILSVRDVVVSLLQFARACVWTLEGEGNLRCACCVSCPHVLVLRRSLNTGTPVNSTISRKRYATSSSSPSLWPTSSLTFSCS